MGMGPIVWTCMALTLHQSPAKVFHWNSWNVGLPITVNSQGRTDIQQFILLYSSDEGKTWEQGPSKRPGDQNPFSFHAPRDGVYWFLVQEVDSAGRAKPSNPNRAKPSIAVVVDTVPPQIKVTTERSPSGGILARWRVAETYPDVPTLRLEYHTAAMSDGQWTPLSVSPALEGKHEFNPGRDGQTGEVRVRVQVKDMAGNVGQGEGTVVASGPAAVGATAGPADPSPFSLIPATQAEPTRQPNRLTSSQPIAPPLEAAPPPPSGVGATTALTPPPTDSMGSGSLPVGTMPLAASSERMSAPPPNASAAPANAPAVKIVKVREVRLDFAVAKVGPSGLGNADIYVTLDNGANWKKLAGEAPISLPPNVNLHGPDPIHGSVGVQLSAEGTVYGFIVAVKSKAGLAPPPPKQGDVPEILVELDSTVPKAELIKPSADPTQANTLLLSWRATDRNLSENPIVLEWSEQLDGTWNAIGGGPLPNSGQYAWHLPTQVPSNVYLRLTVRDRAGNEARAQTAKPVLIDLSVPQTKIIGLAPGTR